MISHLTLAGLEGNSGHFSCAPKKNSTSHLVEIFKQGGGREMRIMHCIQTFYSNFSLEKNSLEKKQQNPFS